MATQTNRRAAAVMIAAALLLTGFGIWQLGGIGLTEGEHEYEREGGHRLDRDHDDDDDDDGHARHAVSLGTLQAGLQADG